MHPETPLAPSAQAKPAPWLDRALASAFLESVPDFVFFKDRECRFIAVSQSIAKQFGCASVYDMLGKTDFDFFAEGHAKVAFEDEQRIMRTGESIIGKLEKETWPNGRITWALTNKLPLRDGSGEIVGTFGVSKDVTEMKDTEQKLEKAQKELRDASRLAGMAEVATGVLHNVGNVLNSLNVSASILTSHLRQNKAQSLLKVAALVHDHRPDIGEFLTADPKGRLIPEFLDSFARSLAEDHARLTLEVQSLQKNIDHIKEIVSMQQAYATMVGVVESLDAPSLLDDALRMNTAALERHDVAVVRDFQPCPPILGERGKVLQILINLIRNAKYAMDEGRSSGKELVLRIGPGSGQNVRLVVQDNGVGIPPENMTRIFGHGFTTRRDGHGFGLHSSALAAKEMRGSLFAQSDGKGKGATFVLELPAAEVAARQRSGGAAA